MTEPTVQAESVKRTGQHRRWGTAQLFSILFALILILPIAASLWDTVSPTPSPHRHTAPPPIDLKFLTRPEYFQTWDGYLNRRLALNGGLTRIKRWIDYRVFATTDVKEVHVGREGWLFPQTSPAAGIFGEAGDREAYIRSLVFRASVLSHLAELSGRRFFLAIAPDKGKIYPEYLGPALEKQICVNTTEDIILDGYESNNREWFVPLYDLLMAAKPAGQHLYDKTGAVWNSHGAQLAAEALLAAVFKGETWQMPQHHDLAARMLDDATGGPDGDLPESRRFSSAVVYGGLAVNPLLPILARHFNRIDMISAETVPSANHGEDLSRYDVVIMVLDEAQVEKAHLDLDRICRMFGVERLVETIHSIPLMTISAQSLLALRPQGEKLEIKALGAQSSFSLPSLPGSDAQAMRMLAMNLTASTPDRLQWRIDGLPHAGGEQSIHKGDNRLYIPLPVQPAVQLHVYPGKQAGLFHLSRANVLEFANGLPTTHTPDEAQPTPARASDAVDDGQTMPGAAESARQRAAEGTSPAMIRLNDFEEKRIFQRTGGHADIVVSGVYKGTPRAIEARVSRHTGDTWSTAWTVIDSSPADGIFMGILPDVPQGGWYRLSVRFSDNPDVMDQGRSQWGIGALVACIGQSNMKEWFHNGSDLTPHPLLAVHRQGEWRTMGRNGNGAIAMGNRLVARLGIPVGLLDYAVNGSGLRKEADWGTGYWLDRSKGSIYDRFVQAAAGTGGALEYVVWMQGEADAARATITESQYRTALITFIEQRLRRDVANGSRLQFLPFLIVDMPKRPVGQDRAHQAIRRAQRGVAEEIADCHIAALSIDLENLGQQHLAPGAYTTLGLRVAQTILYLLGEERYYRGPSVVAATKVDDRTIDIRLVHRGGSDFTPSAAVSGWEVRDRKALSLAIGTVARKDAGTVRISMVQPLSGPVAIRYLYGAMPDAHRAIHDNSPMALPLEPAEIELR